MKRAYLFSSICLFLFASSFLTQLNGQSKVDKINELMSAYNEYGKFNGTILVADEGKVIYKKGFGLANMEWDIPNQTDTKFRIASVSKQFTAMITMQLVAEKKLDLNTPISNYLPDYPKENGDKINIHHLLTHTSGIPNYTDFSSYRGLMRKAFTPDEIVSIFVDSTLLFAPGEKFSYSNSAYVLLGVIIEKVTGKSFEDVLKEKILIPLQMNNTGFDHYSKVLENRASGYHKNASRFVHSSFIDMSFAYTAGAMYSTVEDMFLWDQALYTEKLISKKYMDLIFKEHIPAWGRYYGYGWNIGKVRIGNSDEYIPTIEHDGFVNGFSSSIVRFPSSQSSIILLNNTGGAPFYKMTESIIGILNNQSFDSPKKPIVQFFSKIVDKEGIEKGIEFYEKVKDNDGYRLDENEMNLTGYDFLQSGNTETALAIFKINMEAFPKSFNAYDSYAEALMISGNKTAAIKNYKKSLKLNPENENGIEMLKKLGIEMTKEDLYLLKTEETWGTEMFTFPLNFAGDLEYEGIEEAHFPRGWRKLDSPEFWSYAFAWDINLDTELTAKQVETDLQKYFDGLTNVVNKNKDFTLPKTIAKFQGVKNSNSNLKFEGTIEIFDTFVTNEKMILNVQVEQQYCKQQQKSVILFRFSPKGFDHKIWEDLEKIVLWGNVCEE